MRTLLFVVAAIAGTLGVQSVLSPADVATAVAEGKRLKDRQREIGVHVMGEPGGFNIAAQGPLNRITFAAANAAARGHVFDTLTMPPEMTAPLIFITAVPLEPARVGDRWISTSPATSIIVRIGMREIRPAGARIEQTGWTGRDGSRIDGAGVLGQFDLAGSPAGPLDIAVVTSAGERRYTIASKDRSRVR
jgi:hypothetical protein